MNAYDPPVRSWRVVDQRPTVEQGPNGQVQRVWAIDFTTGIGVNGTANVPLAQAGNEAVVRQAIEDQVDGIYLRATLSG